MSVRYEFTVEIYWFRHSCTCLAPCDTHDAAMKVASRHSVVLTVLGPSPFRTFHVLGVRHMMHMHIPSSTVKANRELGSSNRNKP